MTLTTRRYDPHDLTLSPSRPVKVIVKVKVTELSDVFFIDQELEN